MSVRTIATLVIAVVLGLMVVFILNAYLRKPGAVGGHAALAVAGSPVVVAAAPIKRGVPLQPQLLKVVSYPQGSVPAGSFQTVDQLANAKGPARLAMRDFLIDEPLMTGSVTPPGGRLNLSSMLDPGMQAISIHTSDVSEVSGYVLPGDHVDMILTRAVGDAGQITQVLAEDLKVLGVDQVADQSADKPIVVKTITVEVTPPQAQLINLGQAVGSISLSLRPITDDTPLVTHATTQAALGYFSVPKPPVHDRKSAPGDPLQGPGVIRVTRATETTGYRLGMH